MTVGVEGRKAKVMVVVIGRRMVKTARNMTVWTVDVVGGKGGEEDGDVSGSGRRRVRAGGDAKLWV